eukprot:707795-Rhodomonas_salina.1
MRVMCRLAGADRKLRFLWQGRPNQDVVEVRLLGASFPPFPCPPRPADPSVPLFGVNPLRESVVHASVRP